MLSLSSCGKVCFKVENMSLSCSLKDAVSKNVGMPTEDFYILCNGKIVNEVDNLKECTIHIVPRLIGGKGGFGSMLRAIGAQIEKTTNREACRDLSGRRLRDINEEKRLKNWISQQADREQQAEDRRQKKLERLCQKPKHEFRDEQYDKERSALPEKVEDALEQGLKASCSSGTTKRKQADPKKQKKKLRLWMGSEDELSSSIDSESNDEDNSSGIKDSDSTQSNKGTDLTPEISENNSLDNSCDHSEDKVSDHTTSLNFTPIEVEDVKEEAKEMKVESIK